MQLNPNSIQILYASLISNPLEGHNIEVFDTLHAYQLNSLKSSSKKCDFIYYTFYLTLLSKRYTFEDTKSIDKCWEMDLI